MSKKDIKTNWMMKEYTLEGAKRGNKKGVRDMKLDRWVLCTIYKKKETKKDDTNDDVMNVLPIAQQHPLQIWSNDDENHIMDQAFPLVEAPLTIEDQLSPTFSMEDLLEPCSNKPDFSDIFCNFGVDHVGQCSSSVQIPVGL
ncbi:hypothetical protein ACHQM5_014323 [Ranunculus cassubicifolius]